MSGLLRDTGSRPAFLFRLGPLLQQRSLPEDCQRGAGIDFPEPDFQKELYGVNYPSYRPFEVPRCATSITPVRGGRSSRRTRTQPGDSQNVRCQNLVVGDGCRWTRAIACLWRTRERSSGRRCSWRHCCQRRSHLRRPRTQRPVWRPAQDGPLQPPEEEENKLLL